MCVFLNDLGVIYIGIYLHPPAHQIQCCDPQTIFFHSASMDSSLGNASALGVVGPWFKPIWGRKYY